MKILSFLNQITTSLLKHLAPAPKQTFSGELERKKDRIMNINYVTWSTSLKIVTSLGKKKISFIWNFKIRQNESRPMN